MGMAALGLGSGHLVSNFGVLASVGLCAAICLIGLWIGIITAKGNYAGLQNDLSLVQINVQINIFMEPAVC